MSLPNIVDESPNREAPAMPQDEGKEIDPAKVARIPTPAAEEAQVASPQNEPDEPESPQDLSGVVTKLTPELYKRLLQQWVNRGKPREMSVLGKTYQAYTDGGGYKFVEVGSKAGLDSHYGSLTIGKV